MPRQDVALRRDTGRGRESQQRRSQEDSGFLLQGWQRHSDKINLSVFGEPGILLKIQYSVNRAVFNRGFSRE